MRDKFHLYLLAFTGMLMGLVGLSESKDETSIKDKISIVISIIAFAVSILGFVHTINQDKRVDDITYLQNSLEYNPRWSVVGVIDSISFSFTKMSTVEDTTEIYVEITVISHITYKNSGSSQGRLIGTITSDIPSGDDDIRKIILGSNENNTKLETTYSDDYWKFREIAPGETLSVRFINKIRYMENGWGTLHFLVLYENLGGGLYDNYYWIRYNSKSPLIDLEKEQTPYGRLSELCTLTTSNKSSFVYSRNEKETIISRLKSESKSTISFWKRFINLIR